MPLQFKNIAVGNLQDDVSGNNYAANKAVYILNLNNTLAQIFSDEAGTTPIVQDGVNNVTGARGVFGFWVEAGDYFVQVGANKYRVSITGADYFNNRVDETVDLIVDSVAGRGAYYPVGSFEAGFTYTDINQVGTFGGTDYYIYAGGLTNLPHNVTAGTNPTLSSDYAQVFYGEIDNVQGLRNELNDRALYLTLAEAQAKADLVVGQRVVFVDLGYTTYSLVSVSDTGGFYQTYNLNFKFKLEQEQACIPIVSTQSCTVGTGGNFQNLTEALDFSLKIKTSQQLQKFTITLLSGFVLSEQIDFEGVDLGHVEIVSIDTEVVIDRSSLTNKVGRWYSAFRFKNATAPTISVLFNMDETGAGSLRTGLYLINANSTVSVGAGIKNAGERGVDCTQGSTLIATSANFSGAGAIAMRVATGSKCFCQFANASDSDFGASIGSGATFSAADLVATNCTSRAFSAQGGTNSELNGATLSAVNFEAIYINESCTVNADEAVITSSTADAVYNRAGRLNLKDATITGGGTGTGVLTSDSGVTDLDSASVTNFNVNVLARRGGKISAPRSTLTGAASIGATATEGGFIDLYLADCRKTTGVDSSSDITVTFGGEINANSATGGKSKTPNILDGKGLIKTQDVIRSSGVATIPSGSTSVVVAHNLTIQPTTAEIEATPYNNIGSATKFWVKTSSATELEIFVDQDPLADAEFRWRAEKLS